MERRLGVKLRIRLAVGMAALAIAALFPTVVLAGESQSTSACSAFDGNTKPVVCMSEDANLSSGHDKLVSTGGTDNSNLNNKLHSLSGICNAVVTVGDDWNDCISGMRVVLPANTCVRFYHDANYSGGSFRLRNTGPGTATINYYLDGSSFNDAISSYKVSTTTANC
jgi:hypothetical protein